MTKSPEAIKRKRTMETLKRWGVLPKCGERLSDEQFHMVLKIKNNNFDFIDTVKNELKKTRKIYTKIHLCKCGETNPDMFYPKIKSKCKKCDKLSYKNRPDKKEYIQKQKDWSNNNILHVRLLAAKHRAKRKGIPFNISDGFIIKQLEYQDGKCYISKIPLGLFSNDWNVVSIDRIDSNLGYTEENSVLVTKFINNSKCDMSLDEFINHLKDICSNIF